MEKYQVRLSLTLHAKVINWSKGDQIYFSAFQQLLREMPAELVLAASNCAIESVKFSNAEVLEELSFWMKSRMDYSLFFIRQPVENVLILSDR